MFRSRLSFCGEIRLGFSSIGEKNSLPSKAKQIGITKWLPVSVGRSEVSDAAGANECGDFFGYPHVADEKIENRGLRMEDGDEELILDLPSSDLKLPDNVRCKDFFDFERSRQ